MYADEVKDEAVSDFLDVFADGMRPRPTLIMPEGVTLADYFAAKALVERVEYPE